MIYFRADSNSVIASGHIMRCLSIATYLKKQGAEVCFLTADHNPDTMLEKVGVDSLCLESQWDNLMSEVEKMKNILSKDSHSLLFIDTYQVSRAYVEALLPYTPICYLGSKREYLGKLQTIINYSTDIDYDFYRDNYSDVETKLLLGPKYAPLREEFQNISEHASGKVGHILLTTGNTDQNNIVPKILSALSTEPYFKYIIIDVVVGAMFKNKEELLAEYKDCESVRLHQNVKSMSQLMLQSDLAIAANGTTVYELAASKVPAITFAMVAEQVPSATALSKLGAVNYCGESFSDETETVKRIVAATGRYVTNPDLLRQQVQKASAIIDGDGCKRIAENMLSLIKQ